MLPVVADQRVVLRRMLGHSWAMVAASLVLWPVAGMTAVYGVVAIGLGAVFLFEVYRLRARVRAGVADELLRPMVVFHWSITYLTLLFVAVGSTHSYLSSSATKPALAAALSSPQPGKPVPQRQVAPRVRVPM